MAENENTAKAATVDTVFAAVSADIRQLRDYEMTAAKWYIALLVAMSTVVLSAKFGDPNKPSNLFLLLNNNAFVQCMFALAITSLAVFSSTAIIYAHRLHRACEVYLDEFLPPGMPPKAPMTTVRRVAPRHLLIATHLVIALFTDILIFLKV